MPKRLFNPTLTDLIDSYIVIPTKQKHVFHDVPQVIEEVRIKTAYCKMTLCLGVIYCHE